MSKVLQSRKFWSAVVGLIAILYMSLVNGAELDPDTVVTAIMGIVGAYMGSVALEDGLTAQNANKTTVTTPGGSDVTVIAPPETTPSQPMLDRMG